MHIALACDHAGFELKLAAKQHLLAAGHQISDHGTDSSASCDFPDLAVPACQAVMSGQAERAILFCGSGIGVSIVANKVPGMRCALVYNVETATLARQHNHAQAIAIGGRFISVPLALAMIDAFLAATIEARHQRRVDKISALEQRPC